MLNFYVYIVIINIIYTNYLIYYYIQVINLLINIYLFIFVHFFIIIQLFKLFNKI